MGRSVTSNVPLLPHPPLDPCRCVSLGQGRRELTPALLVGRTAGATGKGEQLIRELFLVGGEAPRQPGAALRGEGQSPLLGLVLLVLAAAVGRSLTRERGETVSLPPHQHRAAAGAERAARSDPFPTQFLCLDCVWMRLQ